MQIGFGNVRAIHSVQILDVSERAVPDDLSTNMRPRRARASRTPSLVIRSSSRTTSVRYSARSSAWVVSESAIRVTPRSSSSRSYAGPDALSWGHGSRRLSYLIDPFLSPISKKAPVGESATRNVVFFPTPHQPHKRSQNDTKSPKSSSARNPASNWLFRRDPRSANCPDLPSHGRGH